MQCAARSVRYCARPHIIRTFAAMGHRIEDEKCTVERMIRLYCRRSEGNAELCPACRELLDYALARLDRCPCGDRKPACKKCPSHCYRPAMREHIRRVMRFAGPRLIFYSPAAAFRHLFARGRTYSVL